MKRRLQIEEARKSHADTQVQQHRCLNKRQVGELGLGNGLCTSTLKVEHWWPGYQGLPPEQQQEYSPCPIPLGGTQSSAAKGQVAKRVLCGMLPNSFLIVGDYCSKRQRRGLRIDLVGPDALQHPWAELRQA